jgi:diketogulonate reductase-like aldo/keto reductase
MDKLFVLFVGARTPRHIEGSAPAADFQLTPADLEEIYTIMQDAVPVGVHGLAE